MIQILSNEESEKMEKEVDQWLLSLDWNTKFAIRHLLEPMIKKSECEHLWLDPTTYENELDKTKLFCRKCHLEKPRV